ncbi:hypothetical protein LY90DRAFT_702199 [Neocallimastix californiae]|uniref:Uncharacterized protein n=1 Tax=Neocallimastix californiae TaxID=1754190 RepID=A0A1Y2D675_9FUNG|nr:hypothetical protein LY90DRAFT_702199 [Neocallimastix californiae]|eukprot:ORY54791.1 hypothetical protein LY90DRAFT_702199 [Neocallimastix californiae]
MDIDKDYINNNTKIEINDINLINKNSVQKKEHPEIVLDDTKNSSFIMNKENNIRNKINKVSRSESTGKVRLCCFKTTRNKKVSTNALNKPISSKNELANKLKDTFKENNKITSKRVEVNPISTNENENSIHNHISSEIDDNTNEKNINDEKNSNPQYIKNNNYKSKGDTITIDDDDDDDDNDSNSNSNSNIARDVNVTKKVTKKGKNTMSNTILPATEKGISSKSIIKPYKPHKISKPRAFRRRKLTKNKSSDSLSNTSSPSQISNENVLLNYTSSSNSNVSSSNSKKSSVSKVNFSNGNRSLRQNSSKRKMNKNVISSIIDLTSPNKNNNYNYSLYNKDNNNTQEPNRLEYLKEKFHKLSIQNDMMKQKCSVASSNFPQHQMSTPKKHKGESKESISQSNLNDISKNIFENEKPKSVRTSPLRLSLHRKKTL